MASIRKRRRAGGGLSWDVTVRVRGYGTRCKTFRSRLEAEAWSSRTESAAHGRTLALGQQVTVGMLLTEALPRLRSPLDAAVRYWREELGTMRVRDVTPLLIAEHRNRLLGAETRSHRHKRTRPRSGATVRQYLAVLAAILKVGVRELRWCETTTAALRGGFRW